MVDIADINEAVSLASVESGLVGVISSSVEEAGVIAKEALAITKQCQAGEFSSSDYKELMRDLKGEKLTMIAADELYLQEQLITIFDAVESAIKFIS